MRTAVMGPIVNVPSLHLTSSADTGSDGLVSSFLNALCVHVCGSQTHHNPVGSWSKVEVAVGRVIPTGSVLLNYSTKEQRREI